MSNAPHQQHIRSFVRRAGRQTKAQGRALSELWPRFGLAGPVADPVTDPVADPVADRVAGATPVLDLVAAFGRSAPCVLEIGFGNGDALASMAAEWPERNFLGVEVHGPGVGHCLLAIERLGLTNVRLLMQDAMEVLRERLSDHSLLGVHLFFPDPWHKKRHHKRRLVQPEFVALLAARIAPGGYVHMATDWPDYAAHIEAVFGANPAFRAAETEPSRPLGHPVGGAEGPAVGDRPRTRFEARGERLGHSTWEAIYLRTS